MYALIARSVTESHTSEQIQSIIKDAVNVEYHLEDRLDCIGTDNGANFAAAVEALVVEGVSEEKIRCCIHTLQLSIKKAIEVPFVSCSS
jgi:hypothetical protein